MLILLLPAAHYLYVVHLDQLVQTGYLFIWQPKTNLASIIYVLKLEMVEQNQCKRHNSCVS